MARKVAEGVALDDTPWISDWTLVSRDAHVLSETMTVMVVTDRCGGRGEMEVPNPSDRGLGFAPTAPVLALEGEVRALVTRHVRGVPQA